MNCISCGEKENLKKFTKTDVENSEITYYLKCKACFTGKLSQWNKLANFKPSRSSSIKWQRNTVRSQPVRIRIDTNR